MRRSSASLAAFAVGLWLAAALAQQPPEPATYRDGAYNAPVPATLKGAEVLTAAQAESLWRAGVAFVDVLPQVPRPPNLPATAIWRDAPHADIPRSLWLPDTGYAQLAPVMRDYLERGLLKALDGDRARPVVIYCKRDCWMSWNAAKRALEMGFTRVAWFPDGVEGWSEAGLPLEPRKPEPRP